MPAITQPSSARVPATSPPPPSGSASYRLSLHPFHKCQDEDVEPELTCPICGDALDHAIELVPCGDMFCLACLESQTQALTTRLSSTLEPQSSLSPVPTSSYLASTCVATCPKCNQAVQEEHIPTRVLVNMLSSIRVTCSECGWEGTREASAQHGCCDAVREANAALKAAFELKKLDIAEQQKRNSAMAKATTSATTASGATSGSFNSSPAGSTQPPTTPASANATAAPVHALPLPSPNPAAQRPVHTTVVPSAGGLSNGSSASSSQPHGRTPPRPSAPLAGVARRADDDSDSALLRNFTRIEDDPNFSTVRRQRTGTASLTSPPDGVLVQSARTASGSSVPGSPSDGGYFGLGYAGGTSNLSTPSPAAAMPDVFLSRQVSSGTGAVDSRTQRESGRTPSPYTPAAASGSGTASNSGTLTAAAAARDAFLRPPAEGCWQRYGMTQAEYDQIMGIFLSFDADGVGRLNRRQFFQLCVCLNYVSTREDSDAVFEEVDTQATGFITLDQFCLWLRENRPDPDALYGLTPFEYNDSMIQFRVADPNYRGYTDWNGFCRLCLTNRYATTTQDAQELFQRCADPASKSVSLHRYFKLLQGLKQQGYAIGGRAASGSSSGSTLLPRQGSVSCGGGGVGGAGPRHSGSNLTTPPIPPDSHDRRTSLDSSGGPVRGSVQGSAISGVGGASIPRPPPRSNPVTGQVITGGRSSQPPLRGSVDGLHLVNDNTSLDRQGSTLTGMSMSASSLDGQNLVASGGRATNASTTPGGRRRQETFTRGGRKKNDCVVM